MAAAVGLFFVRPATAADASRPPTPALFPAATCMVTVDRSVDPVFHVAYDVPFDDTDRGPDEVADGRTLQFFAFRRQFRAPPPNWITWDDVARAMAAPATDPFEATDDDVLETAGAWADGAWVRITPDDARLPITKAQAAMGVSWDTSPVEAGTYVIAAYTFDPVLNLWSPRPGVVRVLDGPAGPDAPPALALVEASPGGVVPAGSEVTVTGCVAAADGSSVTVETAFLAGAEGLDWQAQAPVPAGGPGDAAFSFVVPEPPGSAGQLVVRATVEDPLGRRYTAYLPGALDVTASAADTTGGTTGGASGAGGGGCACHAGGAGGRGAGGWGLGVLLAWARRRKRVHLCRAC